MLYGNKFCDKCQSTYDANDYACSKCGDVKNPTRSKNVINLNAVKQIFLFLVGYSALQFFAAIIQIVLLFTIEASDITEAADILMDSVYYNMVIMTIAYVATFISLIVILLPNYKVIFKSFRKIDSYIKGFIFGMGIVVFSSLYTITFSRIGVNDNQTIAVDLINNYPWFGIVVIGLIGPICEEIGYRLGLYSFCSRFNKRVAYIVSTLVFAFIHFNFLSANILVEIINLPAYIICGLILTYAYEKHGFAASVIAHIFNNVFSTISSLIGAMN